MSTLKLTSQNGSIELSPEDGSGTAQVTLPRGGFLGDSGYQWVDEAANRVVGTTYTNTTGHPIVISISTQSNVIAEMYINGNIVTSNSGNASQLTLIVPSDHTYMINTSSNISFWYELK